MKVLLLAAAAGVLAAQPSIRLDPAVITSCQDGAGQATVIWNAPGRTTVTVSAGESPMTGAEPPAGSVRTGVWVTDGLVFTLRDAAGQRLASTAAVVRCEGAAWWPLEVGNEWHFRRNDRVVTGAHSVWRVMRKEILDGVEWSVLSGVATNLTRLRTDGAGRIYTYFEGRERVLLDPSGEQAGMWTAGAGRPQAVTLAGTFSEELAWQAPVVVLGRESGRLARGVGPTYYQSDVVAGSSGGFGAGYTLLEAVVGGARFVPNYPRVELSLETQAVDFGMKSARNCALPCYFVACFGADAAGTYKPCVEASVRGGAGRLALLDPAGKPVFETAADGWVRIPLYSNPAVLLPPGKYSVAATVNGAAVALPLEIR